MIVPQLKPVCWFCAMKQPHLRGLGQPLDDEAGRQKLRQPLDDEADIRQPLDVEADIQKLGQPPYNEADKGELGQPLDDRDLEHLLDDEADMPKHTTGAPDLHLYINLSP